MVVKGRLLAFTAYIPPSEGRQTVNLPDFPLGIQPRSAACPKIN